MGSLVVLKTLSLAFSERKTQARHENEVKIAVKFIRKEI
jgi:hypothetical protein